LYDFNEFCALASPVGLKTNKVEEKYVQKIIETVIEPQNIKKIKVLEIKTIIVYLDENK
jgi:hypothetical protein